VYVAKVRNHDNLPTRFNEEPFLVAGSVTAHAECAGGSCMAVSINEMQIDHISVRAKPTQV
jgi:hypothetical protein